MELKHKHRCDVTSCYLPSRTVSLASKRWQAFDFVNGATNQ